MKLEWSPLARDCFSHIHTYLVDVAGDDVSKTVLQRIYSRAETLIEFPKRGRIVPEVSDPCVREVLEGVYRIIYEIDSLDSPTTVSILVIAHSAQMLRNTRLEEFFED